MKPEIKKLLILNLPYLLFVPFILNIAVTIIVCCVYYGIALIVTKDEVFMEMFNKVKGRLHG